MNRKLLALALTVGILFSGCGGSEKPNKNDTVPLNSDVSAESQTPFSAYATGLPDKVSNLPSIGATRAAFEEYHRKSGEYMESRIGYDNDNFLADFLDGAGEFSKNQQARAFVLTIQPLPHDRLTNLNIDNYLPSDAYDIERSYDTKNDDMVVVDTITGRSDMLSKIYPQEAGRFAVTIQYDRQTNAFLGANVAAFDLSAD